MRIKEHRTKALTKEILEKYQSTNKIELNLYGLLGDLLFLIKGNQMAVIDIKSNKFVIPYTKGFLKPVIDSSTGDEKIIGLLSTDIGQITWKSDSRFPRPTVPEYSHLYYSIFDQFGRMEQESSCRFICTDDFFRRIDFDSCNLSKAENFDYIYPSKILEDLRLLQANREGAKLISNDKWDAQSRYCYGLSIIYKDNQYGVCDTNYKVVFDYDEDITFIKIISPSLLFVKNRNGLSAIYDIHSGYIIPFKYPFEDVTILDTNILRVKSGNKYRYILNGKISDLEYDSIAYDRGIIIVSNQQSHTFRDKNGVVLCEHKLKEFYKATNDIYYQQDQSIIKENLYTGQKQEIKYCPICDEYGLVADCNIDSLLQKYKYYYIDEQGQMTLFTTMKYGLSIEENGISIYSWHDSLRSVYEHQKRILENLMNNKQVALGEKKLQKVNDSA